MIAVLLVVGCVAPNEVAPAALPVALIGEPLVQDHDHSDRLAHAQAANLALVAHVKPWGDGSDYGAGSVNELAIRDTFVYVSRSNPEGGFAIVDIADPTAPRVVGDFRSEGGADIEVTADNQFVLLMTQRTLPGQQSLDNPTSRAPRGIYVVDVSDKTAPMLSSFFPLPTNGPHTAFYHEAADGREIVAVQTYDLLTSPTGQGIDGVNPLTQRVLLTELVRDANGARLEPRGSFQLPEVTLTGRLTFPHDSYIETHPETGRLLLTIAYWDAGVRIVDISDLARPQEIAAYSDFAPSALVSMHDVKAFPAPLGGRHVTAAGPEIVTAPEDGQLTFIDTTDPTKPTKLGFWSVPGDLVVDVPFLFSPHVFDVRPDGLLVIGHNHAGVWLIDASDPTAPQTLGHYSPHEERPGFTGIQPSVWGARFYDRYVIATDGPTGLYVLEATALGGEAAPAPAAVADVAPERSAPGFMVK